MISRRAHSIRIHMHTHIHMYLRRLVSDNPKPEFRALPTVPGGSGVLSFDPPLSTTGDSSSASSSAGRKEGGRKGGRKDFYIYREEGRKAVFIQICIYIYICVCVCVCVPVDDTVDWSRPDCSSEANVFENNARFISRTWSSRLRRKSRSLGGGSFKSSVRPSCQKSVVNNGQKSLIADLGLKIQKGWFEGRFFLGNLRIGQNIAARCAFMFSALRFFFPRSSASTASIRRYVGSSEADVFERIANTVNVIIVKIEKYTFWRLLQKNDAPKMCGQRRIHTHCSLISDGEREEH